MSRATLSCIGLLGLALCAPVQPAPAAPAGEALAGRPIVLDGDTLRVRGTLVGLHGIAAPGSHQTCEARDGRETRCGAEAARRLAEHVGAGSLACETRGAPDRFGRIPAVCRLDGKDIAAWMVESGLAVADRAAGPDYAGAEDRAWGRRTGLWAGVFEHPAGRVRETYAAAGMLAAR